MYLDTPALALARHGVALRVRRTGRRWEATAKWSGTVAGNVHERAELTRPLSGPPRMPFRLPRGPLAVQLTALVAGRPLRPILTSVIHRRRFDVVDGDGTAPPGIVAELALDRVVLQAPGKRRRQDRYCEVEIELRQGARHDLTRIVDRLRRHCRLLPSVESKFARGLHLLGHAPSVVEPALVSSDDTVESAARKIVARHLARLRRHDPGVRIGKDPEAVHDMRVATRRMRAALRVFQHGFPKALRAYLRGELAWLARRLGAVRDLDVQLAALDRFCSDPGGPERAALAPYRAHLEGRRRQRHRSLLAALRSSRYLRLLAEIEAFTLADSRLLTRSRRAQEPVAKAGRKAIRKTFRRLLEHGDAIGVAPTAEELHALRIRAKRARYLLEFLRDLVDRPGRRLVKRLVELQDQLGAHQDSIVGVQAVRRYAESLDPRADAELGWHLERFAATQLRRAEKLGADFSATWRRLSHGQVRKDLEAVQEKLRSCEAAFRSSRLAASRAN